MRIAHGEEFDNERFTLFNIDADFLAGLHAVKEDRSRQNAGVAMTGLMTNEVRRDAWIEQMGGQIAVTDLRRLLVSFAGQKLPHGLEIDGRQTRSRPTP